MHVCWLERLPDAQDSILFFCCLDLPGVVEDSKFGLFGVALVAFFSGGDCRGYGVSW